MIPGHDSACCVHMAEGAITSHHERTCLFPIVQRIISPCAPHLRPEIQCALELFRQIAVTGRSCQCHHLPGLRSCLGQLPRNRRSGLSVGVLSRDTCKFEKATEGGFHAGQVTNQTASLGKLKGRLTLMEKQRGLHVVGIVTENGGCLTVSRIPSASRRSCARLQFMSDERCRN